MYKALYREYRPETFSEVLGQEHIVKILKNQIAKDEVGHAYLFCGTRGTGKTTLARILAKGINCTCAKDSSEEIPCGKCVNCQSIKNGSFMDVIEIDAASNNGVENIRELRESVKYPPAVGKKKVYIIDEVHMLSSGAFNALLKTLEEPPEYVVFILATTDPQKLPPTVMSRCMRLDFRRVSEKTLAQSMKQICCDKGVDISDEALSIVVSNADGSVRDGLSILEQCLATGDTVIEKQNVLEFLGTAGEDVLLELTDHIKTENVTGALMLLERLLADGKDVRQFIKDWLSHYRNLMILKFMGATEDNLNISSENLEKLQAQADTLSLQDISNAIIELAKTSADAKWSNQPRILLELSIVRLATDLMTGEAAERHPSEEQKPAMANTARKAAAELKPAVNTEKAAHKTEKPDDKTEKAAQPQKEQTGTAEAAQVTESAEKQQYNLSEIWRKIFEEGEAQKASFNLIRTGTKLVGLTDEEILVEADGALKEKYLLDNSLQIETMMEAMTGKRRTVKPVKPGETKEKNNTLEDIESGLASLFGTSIDIR